MSCWTWRLVMVVAVVAAASGQDIYEILHHYGFPPGLVPRNVVASFDWNVNTGQFSVNLSRTCGFFAYDREVQYQTQLSGVIATNMISNLHGVEVRVDTYYWATMNLVNMIAFGEEVQFTVGRTKAAHPAYDFYRLPECDCGFRCGGGRH